MIFTIHNCVVSDELLEIEADTIRCPDSANKLAVEDGDEDHDHCSRRDQCDHAVYHMQELRVFKDTWVEKSSESFTLGGPECRKSRRSKNAARKRRFPVVGVLLGACRGH